MQAKQMGQMYNFYKKHLTTKEKSKHDTKLY